MAFIGKLSPLREQWNGMLHRAVWMLYLLCFIVGSASSEFECQFTVDSLSQSAWTNEGTLGSVADMTTLTGTVKTESTNVAGGTTQALCFDSTQTSELTTMDYDLNAGVRPDLTLIAWFRPDEFTSYDWILGNPDDSGYDRAIVIYDPRYSYGLAATVGTTYSSTLGQLTLGEWVHIVATFSSSGTATVYKNGGDLAGGSQQSTSIARDSVSGSTLTSLNGVQHSAYKTVGCFAQVQLTDRVVSAAEVVDLYADFDSAINRLPSTAPTGAPSTAPTGVPTKSPHKDCSVLHIDDFLTECSQEFEGQNTKVADLEKAVADLQAQLDAVVTQLEEIGTYP